MMSFFVVLLMSSMSFVAVHMAVNKWDHNQSWACFIVVHELRRRAHGSVQSEFHFLVVHEIRRRAHVIQMASQWIMSNSSTSMSFVAVHMALVQGEFKVSSSNSHKSWACCIIIVYELHELCRRPYGPMALISWVHNPSWTCFNIVRELRVHMALIKWVQNQS
jgi:hypothetical protein